MARSCLYDSRRVYRYQYPPILSHYYSNKLIELACQWKVFWLTGLEVFKGCQKIISQLQSKQHKYEHLSEEGLESETNRTTAGDIKQWMWLPGLIAVLILTCVVSKLQYDIPIVSSLLSLFLAFIFSFIAVQATGATGMPLFS